MSEPRALLDTRKTMSFFGYDPENDRERRNGANYLSKLIKQGKLTDWGTRHRSLFDPDEIADLQNERRITNKYNLSEMA